MRVNALCLILVLHKGSTMISMLEPVLYKSRAYDSGLRGPRFKTRLGQLVFSLGKENNLHYYVAQFNGNAHWAEPPPLFTLRVFPTPLKCKNEYLVLPPGEETGSSRPYHLGILQAEKAMVLGDEPVAMCFIACAPNFPLLFIYLPDL